MMDRNMSAALDRYITGNYGNDQYRDDVPEEVYHEACSGEGCADCDNGLDREKLAKYREEAEAEADASYQQWLESEDAAYEAFVNSQDDSGFEEGIE